MKTKITIATLLFGSTVNGWTNYRMSEKKLIELLEKRIKGEKIELPEYILKHRKPNHPKTHNHTFQLRLPQTTHLKN